VKGEITLKEFQLGLMYFQLEGLTEVGKNFRDFAKKTAKVGRHLEEKSKASYSDDIEQMEKLMDEMWAVIEAYKSNVKNFVDYLENKVGIDLE
jgi:hypothetical protein